MLQQIVYAHGWASATEGNISFSGTVNLSQQFPYAFAQVGLSFTLSNCDFGDSDYTISRVYLTGFGSDGNPVPLPDKPNVQGIHNADSFSFEGDVSYGAMFSWMAIYCFE